MVVTRQQFTKRLSDSGLMSPTQLLEFENRLPDEKRSEDVDELARELVLHYMLTEYQVDVICTEREDPLNVGNYLILEKIGQGGMGIVYKAKPRDGGELVALKVLPHELSAEPTAIKRFQREVKLSSQLRHENIVAALDHGEEDNRPFFVMEFVDGCDLTTLVSQRKSLAVLTAFDCVLDAARGLEFAHQNGILHRDIKPANLLINRDGKTKVLDMGLARTISPDQHDGSSTTITELTKAGAVMGTADYLAPEQALNSKNADFRADIYSLGCTMYFAFTGKPVYDGDTMMEKIVAHREQPIPSLRDQREDVPVEVDDIFRRMIAKSPDDRYQTVTELLADMEDCHSRFGHMWMIRRFINEQKIR